MKKIVSVLLCMVMVFSISGCGAKKESKEEVKKEDNKTEKVEVKKQDDVYFKDDVLKIDMATIKITGFEVAPPNGEWGETQSKIMITYDFTNNSDELMQPSTAWIACFDVTQETDTTVDNLGIAMATQDEKYSPLEQMSCTDVKPGATVSSVATYAINDTTKEITLTATQGMGGKELGTKVFSLQ